MTLPGILLDTFSPRIYRFPAGIDAAAGCLLALYRLLGFFNLVIESVILFTAMFIAGGIYFKNPEIFCTEKNK